MQQSTQKYKPLRLYVSGLGGWLILMQIVLYYNLIELIESIIRSVSMFGNEAWSFLVEKGSIMYHPMWKPAMWFFFAVSIFEIIFLIFILVFFYSKRSFLPRLMIIFFLVGLLNGFIFLILVAQIPLAQEVLGNEAWWIVASIVECLVVVLYFKRSYRVQNTFIY
ncbi:DUF2569 family protein [Paenibacillus pinisoli]|uniref:DUF2569 family protein n=1 Tax=Paenibacillus pinisoli TaxID=1276110 RepID=A0A3A6PUU9_9BACL|nr:DUF2569 family protein [Paenibacillus pinisoli]RJX37654.1 DUF2569 family protein [Paenibacillus pinisoli]